MSLGLEVRKRCYEHAEEGVPSLLRAGVRADKGFLEEVILELNLEGWLKVISRERDPCEPRKE